MGEEANGVKMCTYCCFNVLFFISGIFFVIRIFQLLAVKAMLTQDPGPSHNAAFGLTIVAAILMIGDSIFGCVALCVSKRPIYLGVRLVGFIDSNLKLQIDC